MFFSNLRLERARGRGVQIFKTPTLFSRKEQYSKIGAINCCSLEKGKGISCCFQTERVEVSKGMVHGGLRTCVANNYYVLIPGNL